jgi:hypothetical protein
MQTIDQLGPQMADYDPEETKVRVRRGGTVQIGEYTVTFNNFIYVDEAELPENSIIGVKADLLLVHRESGEFCADPARGSSWPPMTIPSTHSIRRSHLIFQA